MEPCLTIIIVPIKIMVDIRSKGGAQARIARRGHTSRQQFCWTQRQRGYLAGWNGRKSVDISPVFVSVSPSPLFLPFLVLLLSVSFSFYFFSFLSFSPYLYFLLLSPSFLLPLFLFFLPSSLSLSSGASIPPETLMHFPPVSDFPPVFEIFLDSLENF